MMDSLRLDPRADLVVPVFDHRAFHFRPKSTVNSRDKRSSVMSMPPASFPRRKPCYDWIFSSASNVHIAIDRSAFKTYIPFRTYVLAIADQRQVPAKGIGTVELKIKRQPGSKESHKVVLENVLYVPNWLCNIISDAHFTPAQDFEHNWSEFGFYFQQRKDDKWRPWGYTEAFCGLERLVLYKDLAGRSPMLEDEDREVYSVNVSWPQHQRTKWTAMVEEEEQKLARQREREAAKNELKEKMEENRASTAQKSDTQHGLEEKVEETASKEDVAGEQPKPCSPAPSVPIKPLQAPLAVTDSNIAMMTTVRTHGLRIPGKSAFREALPWRRSVDV